ncbi:MAG: ATP-binding cassette domain-containing protein, partial [Actinobacteria bacterium]|nr:ATP-binding cassette domain-containing protein [Actinomycetota bacterium]
MTHSSSAPLASLARIGKTYGDGDTEVVALADADLSINPGEILLIEGPSGSGKTTLISILGLLLKPSRGSVFVGGRDVTALPERALPKIRAETFGFVFQGFNLFPALTALENVALAIRMKGGRHPEHEARRLLAAVGLETRMHHLPANLSGGQK